MPCALQIQHADRTAPGPAPRSVFHRQRSMRFYPGWAFAVPTFVLRVPWSLLEATIWSLLV